VNILGISAFYHDSAAALLVDGALVAAAHEERFTRIRHDAAVPKHAARYCLEAAGLEVGDRIVGIDGASIDNPAQLFSSIVTHRPEAVITVDFVRGDTRLQTSATLAGIER